MSPQPPESLAPNPASHGHYFLYYPNKLHAMRVEAHHIEFNESEMGDLEDDDSDLYMRLEHDDQLALMKIRHALQTAIITR